MSWPRTTRETMRNSVRMHSSKSSVGPSRICLSAILRLVGDLVRIAAAVVAGEGRIRAAAGRLGIERGENVLDAVAREQPVDRVPARRDRALAGRRRECAEDRVDRDRAAQRLDQVGEARR